MIIALLAKKHAFFNVTIKCKIYPEDGVTNAEICRRELVINILTYIKHVYTNLKQKEVIASKKAWYGEHQNTY